MGYARARIVIEYCDTSDFSDPVVRNLTSGYALPSTVSAYMPMRDAAPSGGMTIYTSTLTSGFGLFYANRGTAGGMNMVYYTSAGACSTVALSGQCGYIPHFLPASNVVISGTSAAAAVPFEFLALGI
jgi:hypothetical protein